MRIVWIEFDKEGSKPWKPDDPGDCETWSTVAVGNNRGTANYQVHICTSSSISRLRDKSHCFVIAEYRGVEDLVRQLDAFITAKVRVVQGDPYHELAKYWAWEHGRYDERGRLLD